MIEYRKDISGIKSRINIKRGRRFNIKICPFCDEFVEKYTPKFDFIKDGRLRKGDSILFPNKYPISKYHAVIRIKRNHDTNYSEEEIYNSISLALDFARIVYDIDKNYKFVTIFWNSSKESGASIEHPHMQVIIDKEPPFMTSYFIRFSKEYFDKYRKNYFEELVSKSIFSHSNIYVTINDVPLCYYETILIFRRISNLLDLDENSLKNFSKLLSNIIKFYYSEGFHAFNLSSFSHENYKTYEYFYLHFRTCTRKGDKVSDIGAIELFQKEQVIDYYPEELSKKLLKFPRKNL